MKTIIREQFEQQKLTENNKANLIVHALKPVEGTTDTDLFLDIVSSCDLSSSIAHEDVIECVRLGPERENQIRPLKVKLSSVDKKRLLFRNLGKWRAKLQRDNERDPLEKTPQIDHDLTKEQREERKSLVEKAKAKQAELPVDSPFRIRVRGAPGEMRIVKIDSNGKWTALETSLLT